MTMVEKIRGELGNARVNLINVDHGEQPEHEGARQGGRGEGWIVKPFKGTAVLETFKKLVA